MNEPSTFGIQSADLSSIVEALFSQKLQVHLQILQQLKQEMEARQHLHDQILQSIDEQIRKRRSCQLEFESQMNHDWSLSTHPRRGQIEQQVSEWEKQRIHHLALAWEHLERLKREYREAWKEFQQAFQTQSLLQNITENRYCGINSIKATTVANNMLPSTLMKFL